MCRLFIYKGIEINIKKIIWNAENSIFKQAYHKVYTPLLNNRRDSQLNVDGFGLSIYNKTYNKPCLYKNIIPPWNDSNILNLLNILSSNLLFVHIRSIKAFSNNQFVHQFNSHPFCFENISFMHNGDISNPECLKKYVYENISENLIKNIKGNTDSELIFHIFLDELKKIENNKVIKGNKKWIEALKKTIKIIENITKGVSSMNLCITDGNNILCSRYINSKIEEPPSLYYNKKFLNVDYGINEKSIIISSEPILYSNTSDWNLIPKNSLISINSDNIIEIIIL